MNLDKDIGPCMPAGCHVVPNLSSALLKFRLSEFIRNKSQGLQIGPERENGSTTSGHRWPTSELFEVILLFPEGLNGLIAFTANGYIIPLLSPEIFSTVNLFYNYQ